MTQVPLKECSCFNPTWSILPQEPEQSFYNQCQFMSHPYSKIFQWFPLHCIKSKILTGASKFQCNLDPVSFVYLISCPSSSLHFTAAHNPPLSSSDLPSTCPLQDLCLVVPSARNASFPPPQVFLRLTSYCIQIPAPALPPQSCLLPNMWCICLCVCVFICFLILDSKFLRTRNLFYPQYLELSLT